MELCSVVMKVYVVNMFEISQESSCSVSCHWLQWALSPSFLCCTSSGHHGLLQQVPIWHSSPQGHVAVVVQQHSLARSGAQECLYFPQCVSEHRDLRPLEIASHLEPPAQNVVVLCKVGVRLFPLPLVSERLPGVATRYPISRDIPHQPQRCADRHCSFCDPQVMYLLE